MNVTAQTPHDTQTLPSTLVVGLGATGLSVLRFLHTRGERVAVTDSRVSPPGHAELAQYFADVPAVVGGFDAALFAAAQQIIVSPGVAVSEPLIQAARARGAEIIGDIELFARHADAPVVAITGSNGKSTVTTLLGEMAQMAGKTVRVGGNIGHPALDLLSTSETGTVDFYLLELSSFQLETTDTLNAAAAVVLNVSPDHMDRYADAAAYAASKQRVYRGDGLMLLNRDDAEVMAMQASGRSAMSFGLNSPASNDFGIIDQGVEQIRERWLARGKVALMPVSELRMAGRHNQANALAALALGEAMDLPMAAMLATLKRFAGFAHRTQWVAELDGVRWYNDSKGTNVGATLAAISGLEGPLVLLAGGQGKGADFSPLRAALADKGRAAVLMGEATEQIAQSLGDAVPIQRATDMQDAVSRAQALARSGDTVLLSPACASFDMFAGFAARGDAFMAAVQALSSQSPSPQKISQVRP